MQTKISANLDDWKRALAWAAERCKYPEHNRRHRLEMDRLSSTALRVCYNCKRYAMDHAKRGKCLFEPTHWDPE